jgi:hypothetical protein
MNMLDMLMNVCINDIPQATTQLHQALQESVQETYIMIGETYILFG